MDIALGNFAFICTRSSDGFDLLCDGSDQYLVAYPLLIVPITFLVMRWLIKKKQFYKDSGLRLLLMAVFGFIGGNMLLVFFYNLAGYL